jgi:hypothetical protein
LYYLGVSILTYEKLCRCDMSLLQKVVRLAYSDWKGDRFKNVMSHGSVMTLLGVLKDKDRAHDYPFKGSLAERSIR